MELRQHNRLKRHNKIRSLIHGTAIRPRLSVYRSLKHISAQLIDDDKGVTILSASDRDIKTGSKKPVEIAFQVGVVIAEKSKNHKIKSVIFDRGGNRYHGRVKALAEGARSGNLGF